ncbi:MAG: hypothetical protein KF864_13445 [Phycisphaeraceae bacterium]|nr:hypothetical protein [Phycisphaeraceae bacterium]
MLAWLGWQAIPVARLGDDVPGSLVRKEMEALGVNWDHVRHTATAGTPTIIQEFVTGPEGQPVHRFRVACPTCRGFLPRYTAPTISMARESLLALSAPPDVLYFDRASAAAIDSAKSVRTRGGLVVYEPVGAGDLRLFARAVSVSDIVKYSSDHRSRLASALAASRPRLEIETLGAAGLRFRSCTGTRPGAWTCLAAYPVERFRDAAGAGDCCTAGLIWCLAQFRHSRGWSLGQRSILSALRFGQALASINCAFVGARGMMRAVGATTAITAARQMIGLRESPTLPEDAEPVAAGVEAAACNACAGHGRGQRSRV